MIGRNAAGRPFTVGNVTYALLYGRLAFKE